MLMPKMFHQALQSFSGRKKWTLVDLLTWKSWNRTLLSLSLMVREALCTRRCCFHVEPHITAKWGIKTVWFTKSKWAQYSHYILYCLFVPPSTFQTVFVPKSFFIMFLYVLCSVQSWLLIMNVIILIKEILSAMHDMFLSVLCIQELALINVDKDAFISSNKGLP